MQNTETMLSIENLKKYFPVAKTSFWQRRPYLRAVENISLQIRKGETFGLVGESGCGKSTFGRTVLQLYKPTEGRVVYYGEDGGTGTDLTALSPAKMRRFRRDMQIIFQDPYSSLNPRMTVGQIIEEGIVTHKLYPRNSPALRQYVLEIMKKCGLQPYMQSRYPHQFSGGQRQRVCIARALALRPKFVVCDECVSALDVSIQSQILNLLSDLKQREKLTYLFISHDLNVVRYISDRIGVMYLGKIVEIGKAEDIFSNPRHPYTLALISAAPTMEGEKNKRKKIILQGALPSPVHPPKGCPFHTRCFMAQEICKNTPPPFQEVETGHFSACHFAQKKKEEMQKTALAISEK